MSMDAQTVREIIKEELPNLVKTDPYIRQLIIELSRQQIEGDNFEISKKDVPIELESHLTAISNKLKRATREYAKRLEDNNKEIQSIRKDILKNMEEIDRIHRLVNVFDRDHEISLGDLKVMWGY